MGEQILVAYGTKYGSTAEIADAIATALREDGFEVELRRAREVRGVDGYAAVVLGSAVYMGRWRGEALRVLKRRRAALAERPVWLFSSGPVGDPAKDDDPKAERWLRPPKVQALARQIGARDHAVFGGSVTEEGGPLRRKIAKDTPDEWRDRRDWDEVRAWAHEVGEVVRQVVASRR